MYSSRKHLQARFAPSLRNRFRASKPPPPAPTTTSDQPSHLIGRSFSNAWFHNPPAHERLSFCEDDLLDLDPEDIPEASTFHPYPEYPSQSQSPLSSKYSASFLTRSRSSLTRIKSLSLSKKLNSRRVDLRPELSSKQSEQAVDLFPPSPIQETTTLILAFPCPPNSNTLPLRQGRIVSIDTSEDEASSIFNGTDPFRASASSTKVETPPSTIVGEEISRDPNTILPSPPLSRVATPTSIAPSAAISSTTVSTFRKSIQRLRSIKKGNFFSFHHLAQKVSPNPHTDNEAPSRFLLLPELSFDPAPLSVSLHEDNLPIESSPPADKGAPATPHLHDTRSDPIPQFPLVRYECVDPRELQASPAVTASVEFSPSATPLPPPSPSWLSRNIHDLEPTASRTLPVPQIPPPSPAPLPILPRSALPVLSHPSSPVGLFGPESCTDLRLPETPRTTNSSVTVYSHSKRLSRLSPPINSSSPASVNRLSVVHYRQSVAEDRKSVQSFITCASVSFVEDKDDQLSRSREEDPVKPRFYLLLHPPSPEVLQSDPSPTTDQPPLSPLELFDNKPFSHLPDSSLPLPTTEVTTSAEQPTQSYHVFVPPRSAYHLPDPPFPLPNYLLALARSVLSSPMDMDMESPIMSSGVYGKPMETVDYGDEVDYSGYEWFKERPQRPEPEPMTPQPAAEPYVPQPGVIEQNEMFLYALKCAPNVAFSRFKQFGQLGVLGWCAEFSEMIDALKHLGFGGNMFVSTRTQALETCAEILQLDWHIEMQIIIMYLCSQVARLRRFLDGDTEYDDYPQPNFPMEPQYNAA